ncbi:MAG: hypothetical protein ACJA13_004182, partial [Paraglaciecola sp.]
MHALWQTNLLGMLIVNSFTTPKNAHVADVKGTVQADLAQQGSLQSGDRIAPGTVLTLNKGSEISLSFDDGSQQRIALPLGEGQDLLTVEAITAEEQTAAQAQAANTATPDNVLADIDAIQALIESGEDITTPDTAAGGETGNEGTSTVTIARDGEELLAQAGFDTQPLEIAQATTERPATQVASNQPPLTQSDVNVVAEDTTASGNVLDNDSDADNVLSVQSYTVAGDATVYLGGQSATVENGNLTVNTDGSYTFIPADDWNGELPVVSYLTNTNETDTLSISVTPVNDAPVAENDSFSVREGEAVTGNVISHVDNGETASDT